MFTGLGVMDCGGAVRVKEEENTELLLEMVHHTGRNSGKIGGSLCGCDSQY